MLSILYLFFLFFTNRFMRLFFTLAKPTAPMKKEAASAGVLDTPFGKFAGLQKGRT